MLQRYLCMTDCLRTVFYSAKTAMLTLTLAVLAVLFILAGILILLSLHRIGPTEVGLVTRRFSNRRLTDDNPIAFQGEAGYQAELLMPGIRFQFCLLYAVQKYPWVQIPATHWSLTVQPLLSASQALPLIG